MYTIIKAKSFNKSFLRLKKSGELKGVVVNNLLICIDQIATGVGLDKKFNDHALKGDFEGYRECHIKGDLLLIYRIDYENLILVLVDLGSHSYLFG